jgi:hypothetical protein
MEGLTVSISGEYRVQDGGVIKHKRKRIVNRNIISMYSYIPEVQLKEAIQNNMCTLQ